MESLTNIPGAPQAAWLLAHVLREAGAGRAVGLRYWLIACLLAGATAAAVRMMRDAERDAGSAVADEGARRAPRESTR